MKQYSNPPKSASMLPYMPYYSIKELRGLPLNNLMSALAAIRNAEGTSSAGYKTVKAMVDQKKRRQKART